MPIISIARPADLLAVPAVTGDDARPLLVSISGLTGAGKSTILRTAAELVAARRSNVVLFDEKAIHHAYLDQLFHNPADFGLELQLEFMVARALFIKRWVGAGHSLVMERSHLEDPVFVRHLRASGHITEGEERAYLDVWTRLSARLPTPDLVVFLDVPAEVSIDRLNLDESEAGRPAFPDAQTQGAWVTSWHRLYRDRFDELRSDPDLREKILTLTPDASKAEIRDVVALALKSS